MYTAAVHISWTSLNFMSQKHMQLLFSLGVTQVVMNRVQTIIVSAFSLMASWITQSEALLSTGGLTVKSPELPAALDVFMIQQPQ